jgi:acyl-CoA synthetase (NDP forming)
MQAADAICASLEQLGRAEELEGFLVQEMAPPDGTEMFVGMTHDPTFGPLLACGAGGTLVELLRDISLRITPLTDLDASEMLRSLKTWPLFGGYRGSPPLDAAALQELILRVSAMVEDLPHIAELDLNPVLVYESGKGCSVVDARVRLTRPLPGTPRGARTKTAEV